MQFTSLSFKVHDLHLNEKKNQQMVWYGNGLVVIFCTDFRKGERRIGSASNDADDDDDNDDYNAAAAAAADCNKFLTWFL